MRNWLVGLMLLMSLAFVYGCDTGNQVRVAVAGPFTGTAAAFGEMIKRGAQLKEKEINEAGGINGKMLKLVFKDDAGKPKDASNVANSIADNRRFLAVVGHFNSSCSLAGKPIYKQKGIVELSPGSTNVKVCEGSDWTFRNLYRDDFQGQFVAEYVNKYMNEIKTVAILFDNDDYGRGLRDGFTSAAGNFGLNIVASEAYDRNSTDFKAQLTGIKAKNPDLVFISGLYSEAGLIVKQGREVGITAQFFGADGVDSPDFLTVAGDAAEGTYLTTPFIFSEGGGEALRVAEAFKTEFNGIEPDTWAALSYDAVGMIAEAIEKTFDQDASLADKRKAIRDHLASLDTPEKGYTGITGLTYFDKNGDTVNKPAYVKIVENGKFITAPQQLLNAGSQE
ncbi:MAG: ABC transporter substrate-binding protein [Candidatus Poribacteria bacterium]|nr:ABC transporter substrate-binding protein [Candidatus Poribacteria bacterium]MDE0315040.1 ABC transporter substrate-binding protein [Candidatus Poribacteria bacterium]